MSKVTTHREAMVAALKSHLVQFLRQKGFMGSFPHFRRVALPRVDYLTVQFNRDGGSFVVELATSGECGKPSGYGSDLPVAKLTTHHFRERHRLGTDPTKGISDHWYKFGPGMFDQPTPVREVSFYADIAKGVRESFERDGAMWLESKYIAA